MCDADAGMVPSYWVQGRELPMPDFYTRHQCRDFYALKDWTLEHRIIGDDVSDGNGFEAFPREKDWTREDYAASHQY